MLVKSYRFRASSTSSEDKVSSSSFAQSTSTALSMDLSTNPTSHYHQQLEPTRASISPITSADSFQHYDNYLSKTGIVHGLVPQTILSPRFHRQQQVLDERRRTPLQIRSPSLSRINPFIDHASLATTKERQGSKRVSSPQVTRLENGDVIISAWSLCLFSSFSSCSTSMYLSRKTFSQPCLITDLSQVKWRRNFYSISFRRTHSLRRSAAGWTSVIIYWLILDSFRCSALCKCCVRCRRLDWRQYFFFRNEYPMK